MDVVEVLSEEIDDDCIVDMTEVLIEERTEEVDMAAVLVGERLEQVESCVTDTVAVLFE